MISHELTRRFANGKGAVFVGAGLSMGSGYPSWNKLVEPLRTGLELADADRYTPEQIAGWYELGAERKGLMKFLNEELDETGREPTPCHEILATLPVELYFTTNFDRLLERSMPNADVVIKDVDFSRLDTPNRKLIIKVHGDLSNGESVVFTRSDYDHYLENRPTISELIRLTLMQRTVLFLGYSFSDRNLTTILAQVGRRLGDSRATLFAVIFDANEYQRKELETKYGVTVITPDMSKSDTRTTALHKWLRRFAARVDLLRKGVADTQEVLPMPNLPVHGTSLPGRDAEVDAVKGALSQTRIVEIYGAHGVGKTALALEVARRCDFNFAPRFDEPGRLYARTVYVDASGCRAWPQLFAKLVECVAERFKLGVFKQRDTTAAPDREGQIRELLDMYRVLIVIDNVDADIKGDLHRWLEGLPGSSSAIVVSRTRSSGYLAVEIGGLAPAYAEKFLRERLLERRADPARLDLTRLADAVGRNPQAMRMLAGQLAQPGFTPYAGPAPRGADGFEPVLDHAWTCLSQEARQLLAAASMFRSSPISEEALRATAGIGDIEFTRALATCENLVLLERSTEPRPVTGRVGGYTLHQLVAARAARMLAEDPQLHDTLFHALADYYTGFVEKTVKRIDPPVPYWDALVTQDMVDIDDEWPTIRAVMSWAVAKHPAFVESMVFLLVHYMDTRSLHRDRIEFARCAIDVVRARGDRLREALLRIDALGWTLIDEERIAEARDEIGQGLALVGELDPAERRQLEVLASTWLAHAACVDRQCALAIDLIGHAIDAAAGQPNWIVYRVRMVAGDIHAEAAEYAAAVQCYSECRTLVNSYGGEEGYQMLPRLGIAHLLLEEADQARKVFEELRHISESDHIEVGSLYAHWGLAYLAAHDPALRKHALAQLRLIRSQLSRSTSVNLLHGLMDRLAKRLDEGPAAPV